jgi:hypothetical protein
MRNSMQQPVRSSRLANPCCLLCRARPWHCCCGRGWPFWRRSEKRGGKLRPGAKVVSTGGGFQVPTDDEVKKQQSHNFTATPPVTACTIFPRDVSGYIVNLAYLYKYYETLGEPIINTIQALFFTARNNIPANCAADVVRYTSHPTPLTTPGQPGRPGPMSQPQTNGQKHTQAGRYGSF